MFVKLVSNRYHIPVRVPKLPELVERIAALLRSEQRRTGGSGLQPVHVQVLDYLARCNRYSNTPIAVTSYLGSTKGTTSQSLLVLKRKGLIRKVTDPKDRRVVRLALTDKGRRLQQRLAPSSDWLKACCQLDDDARASAEATLEQLLRSLQRAGGNRTFGQCRTCRHLLHEPGSRFRCGLTREPLAAADTEKICYEHSPLAPIRALR